MMRELSLPAQAYLLALNVERHRLPDRQRAGYLIRAAALTDLLTRGRVTDDNGMVAPVAAGATGDVVLDDVLAHIAEHRPAKWKTWIRRDFRGTLAAVEAQLEAAGVIRVDHARVLGLFPSVRPVVLDARLVEKLRARIIEAVRGPKPVHEVTSADAALASLVAAIELKSVISGRDRRENRARLDALASQGGATVPALRKVFRDLRAVRASAASSGGGG
ncbi:GPP34 family phosphoprotein [Amycolatopsis sp. NPDC059657]|uniref:GOLPH3/VPS74 family protein n=1 Tax=Amycolatopsis sp. NPDC059657 TaxID=3346899 RepID=UPI00366F3D39